MLVGNGLRRLAFLALPEEARDDKTVDAVFKDLVQYYADHPVVHSKVYPGIRDLLTVLREKQVKLAILSNKTDSLVQTIIKKLFPLNMFDLIRGELSGIPRKPNPSSTWDILAELDVTPKNSLFVGDSENDILTAQRADCPDIGVSWGFRGRKLLQEAGANRIIDSPWDLLDIMGIKVLD
jgi:phosphoglycolate phosphatase